MTKWQPDKSYSWWKVGSCIWLAESVSLCCCLQFTLCDFILCLGPRYTKESLFKLSHLWHMNRTIIWPPYIWNIISYGPNDMHHMIWSILISFYYMKFWITNYQWASLHISIGRRIHSQGSPDSFDQFDNQTDLSNRQYSKSPLVKPW